MQVARIVIYGYFPIYTPRFSSSSLVLPSSKNFKMSYTYTILVIVYVVVVLFPKEDLESLDWIIVLLMLIVIFAVSVDEIWG